MNTSDNSLIGFKVSPSFQCRLALQSFDGIDHNVGIMTTARNIQGLLSPYRYFYPTDLQPKPRN